MPSPLDGKIERHQGPEPKVLASDVRQILAETIRPGEPNKGIPVELISEKAKISARTIYRIMQGKSIAIPLHQADLLCLACGSHLAVCRLVWPGGRITSYQELR